ncbi:hypothetical protein K491DRAFT_624459 [Lophiostoma macrostomum CBS 122681]|uniref:Uncharacterized protein n=1 Tax=Lophiostoma macrostomum CBS 122681 TaxID=1314788 RepID=A0A6A6TIF4_9PLEO|nr:hypothetical protein K491DRAFT_624459 [Lophiostoma macrostomum CBS 122681]
MSLGIYGSSGTPRLYTMVTTRKLALVYFDGQSASLTALGTLDSQMALLQNEFVGNPSENVVYDEDQRALDMCALIQDLNLDGIIRMNAGFEVMICNYVEARVIQVYSTNVTVPGNEDRENDPTLPQDPNREPPLGFGNIYAAQNSWEWIRSCAWHYGTSHTDGSSKMESRVELDLCSFISYYDPSLRSLSGRHQGELGDSRKFQGGWGLRRGHRLSNISKEDVATVKSWLKDSAKAHNLSSHRRCSGVNWQALIETITDQHRTRAREILAAMKGIVPTVDDINLVIETLHKLSHAILYSYLQYQSTANVSAGITRNLTITRCSSIYTEHLDPSSLNRFEMLIKDSIHVVMLELCSWEWDLFEWSERHTTNLLDPHTTPSNYTDEGQLVHEFKDMIVRASSIMEWIGWDNWHDCGRKCEPNELCYIPMWPVIFAPGKNQGGLYVDDPQTEEEISEFWRPKCLNRTQFDKGGGRAREPSHRLPKVPVDPLH